MELALLILSIDSAFKFKGYSMSAQAGALRVGPHPLFEMETKSWQVIEYIIVKRGKKCESRETLVVAAEMSLMAGNQLAAKVIINIIVPPSQY